MKKEQFFENLSNIDDRFIEEAKNKPKKSSVFKQLAVIACAFTALAVIAPYVGSLFPSSDNDGSGGNNDGSPEQPTVNIDGAVYQLVDMDNTFLLDEYDLPHTIADCYIGKHLDTQDIENNYVNGEFYTFNSFAHPDQTHTSVVRNQKAVYIVKLKDGSYTYALFCNFYRDHTNAHEDADTLMKVYDIDSPSQITDIRYLDRHITDTDTITRFYNALISSTAMGNDDFQATMFGNLTEAEAQKASKYLAENCNAVVLKTQDGLVVQNLYYYPTINYFYWAGTYFKL